jgi:hypothetical protein
MVEKEFSATPNMLSKHDVMLVIIIPTKKKEFLLQIIKKQGNFKLHFGAHLNAIYDMICLFFIIRILNNILNLNISIFLLFENL